MYHFWLPDASNFTCGNIRFKKKKFMDQLSVDSAKNLSFGYKWSILWSDTYELICDYGSLFGHLACDLILMRDDHVALQVASC